MSTHWNRYRKSGVVECRPYIPGEDITGISLSQADKDNGNPKEGGMIARDRDNPADQWYINPEFFQKNYDQTPLTD